MIKYSFLQKGGDKWSWELNKWMFTPFTYFALDMITKEEKKFETKDDAVNFIEAENLNEENRLKEWPIKSVTIHYKNCL